MSEAGDSGAEGATPTKTLRKLKKVPPPPGGLRESPALPDVVAPAPAPAPAPVAATPSGAPPQTPGAEVPAQSSSEEAATQKELEEIRVRTMSNLVELLSTENGAVRCLYLTNSQANLFTGATIPKMFNALEVETKPKLVIQLIASMGTTYLEFLPTKAGVERLPPIGISTLPSELSFSEGSRAVQRISLFMKETLLPLAAETNAVIICSAYSACELSQALCKEVKAFAAQNGGKCPFTVLAVASAMVFAGSIVAEEEGFAGELCKKSVNWSKNKHKMVEAHIDRFGEDPDTYAKADIIGGLDNYVIVECCAEQGGKWKRDASGLGTFLGVLNSTLSADLPTIAVRTGRVNESMPLEEMVDMAGKGIPVLILDSRERPESLKQGNITQTIQAAIAYSKQLHQAFRDDGRTNNYDVSELAFFHDILHGEASPFITSGVAKRSSEIQPLWKFIEIESKDQEEKALFAHTDVSLILDHIVEEYIENMWFTLDEEEREEISRSGKTPAEFFSKRARARWMTMYDLVTNKNKIYSANLLDQAGVRNLIKGVVRIDRVPTKNSYEAGLIERDGWILVDMCAHYAGTYKRSGLFVTLLLTVLGVILVSLPVLDKEITDWSGDSTLSTSIVFFLSLFATLVTGLNAYYKPITRWKQLRNAAEVMSSEIYKFRTRTCNYAAPAGTRYAREPELDLQQMIANVKVMIMQAADLGSTSFNKTQKEKAVYKHGQTREAKGLDYIEPPKSNQVAPETASSDKKSDEEEEDVTLKTDDFHSPLVPTAYIQHRILPRIAFFESRLPRYNGRKSQYTILLLLATATSSALSQLDLARFVSIVMAISAAVTGWMEFTSVSEKLSRYNSALVAFKNLLLWWNSLTQVEKASLTVVNNLVGTAENIICNEVNAWAAVQSEGTKDDGDEEDEKKE